MNFTRPIQKITGLHLKNKMRLLLAVSAIFFFGITPVYSQPGNLSGKVINENGEPVPSASITVAGSHRVVTTNSKGVFALRSLPAGATLIISSAGYNSKEYVVNDTAATPVIISLQTDTKMLKEVEVVSNGYQSIPKERATGSFVKIDNAMLNQQTGTNVLSRLDGITSGLLFNIGKANSNPQNKLNISIRGLSTINGPLDPLIVLDGFIYEGNIENLNPNDVDNITVLKDAAATSIWGTRAGNGVIVITTKKGRFNQKMQVGRTAGVIMEQRPDFNYLPHISTADYIDLEQVLFNNGYYASSIGLPEQPVSPAVQIFLNRSNGIISSSDSLQMINSLKTVNAASQYSKYFYRNPFTQQYAVSLSGGGSNNTYNLSLGYDNNIGQTYNQFNKLNIKVENNFKPVNNLILNVGLYYTGSRAISGRPPYNSITIRGRQVPYLKFADDAGNALPIETLYTNSYVDTAGAGKLLDWKYYPLEDYKHEKTTSNLQEIFAFAGVQYKIAPFINIDLRYQYQKQATIVERLSDGESFSARNTVNLFTQVDPNSGVLQYIVPPGGIRYLVNDYVQSHTIRGQLNINKAWRHNSINAIVGSEAREVVSTGESNIVYGYNSDPLTRSNVDFINYYPTFINGGYQSIYNPSSSSKLNNRFVSLYANASYTFKGKYIISSGARRDGSNIFGVSTNDRWKPLWSAGAAWNISSESFYNFKLLPILKLRGTYGYSGNVDLSKSAAAVGRYIDVSSNTNFPYARVTTLNNPDLRWERTAIFNLGLDFSSKNNILSGSIEMYRKYGKDLYGGARYDYTAWGYLPELTRNLAAMRGRGVDVNINSKNIDNALKWYTTLLLNYNTDKTTKYDNAFAKNIYSKLGNASAISPFIGKPLYSIAAYKWGGLDNNGNPQGYVNGQLSTDYQMIFAQEQIEGLDNGTVKYIGSTSPLVFGSLINSFDFKNLSLSFNISYKLGYYFKKTAISYSNLIITGGGNRDYENRWQKPGDEKITNVPSFIYPSNSDRDNFYNLSEVNVLKADNVRLQYINLAYTLSSSVLKRIAFNLLQVYFNASNLGLLWRSNKEKLDPDYPSSLVPSKTISFGPVFRNGSPGKISGNDFE